MNIGQAVGLVPVIVATDVVVSNVQKLKPKSVKKIKVKKVKAWKI